MTILDNKIVICMSNIMSCKGWTKKHLGWTQAPLRKKKDKNKVLEKAA